MTDNVLQAAERFGSRQRQGANRSLLDLLRQTKRVELEDRELLAKTLGRVAAEIDRDRPHRIAKVWFERAWQGDRWAKRKRFICFPGEATQDPRVEGAYVAAGSDWAALIDQASYSLFPNEDEIAQKERSRVARNWLRGTSFLPNLKALPPSTESAKSLMQSLATKVTTKLETDTDLGRLWDVLAATPIDIVSYEVDRPETERLAHCKRYDLRCSYEGDEYSLSPLGEVAKLASTITRFQPDAEVRRASRFEVTSQRELFWPYPELRLGLLGHKRRSRIFVVPPDFMAQLDDVEDDAPDERVFDWLRANGLTAGKPYEELPDTPFDEVQGYGWRSFTYEQAQAVWLEVRPKAESTFGLWLTVSMADLPHLYPADTSVDTLAIEAHSPTGPLDFLSMGTSMDSHYEFLGWPTHSSKFLADGQIPAGGVSGLLDSQWEELPWAEGWLDDFENGELQELLFRNAPDVRFCASISVDSDLPPPCQPGTIAAALFDNASGDPQSVLARILFEQAKELSSAGLEFHSALLAQHRERINQVSFD